MRIKWRDTSEIYFSCITTILPKIMTVSTKTWQISPEHFYLHIGVKQLVDTVRLNGIDILYHMGFLIPGYINSKSFILVIFKLFGTEIM